MKKVLLFSDNSVYGGSERLVYSIIMNEAIASRYRIIFTFGNNSRIRTGIRSEYPNNVCKTFILIPLITDAYSAKINSFCIPAFFKYILKFPFWLIRRSGIKVLVNLFILFGYSVVINPDIIHINNGGYPGSINCRLMTIVSCILHKKCIFQVNNQAFERKKMAAFYDLFVRNTIDTVIVASKLAKNTLALRRKFSLNKIQIIPNTIRDEDVQITRKELLQKYGMMNKLIILTQVAFLEYRKGQTFLLDALKIIKEQDSNLACQIVLFLVGSGEDEEILRRRVHILGIDNMVVFAGYQPNSIDYINACDIFILPSISNEDMPLVILSAMKLGKNIIASRFAGIEEEIVDQHSGWLVDPVISTLPISLYEAIRMIVYNNISFGENARERFHENFSLTIYTKAILNLYNNI